MRIHVLGSAAGGGFPQWNCNCSNCDRLRQGNIKATARTQSSIAASSDGTNWVLNIYCTDMVHQDLTTGHPLFNVLGHYCGVNWHSVPLEAGAHFTIDGVEGLRFTAVPLSSKAPPYSPHRHDPHLGDNISVRVEDLRSGKNLYYAPGLGKIEPHILPYMKEADCLMVDGTFWRDDEMVIAGLGNKLASEMAC